MNILWLVSYLTDCLFTALYSGRQTFSPRRQRRWLKPLLLLAFLPLYLNSTVLVIPYSFIRVMVRAVLYFIWLYWAEGVPGQASIYAALFWTAVYTLFQNVFFGPYFNPIFMGQEQILPSPFWSQALLALINVMVRTAFFGVIALLFPFSGMAGSGASHVGFTAGVCLIAIYTKSSGTNLLTEFSDSPAQFSTYYILLHGAILLFLLIFEYSRRQSVEHAAVALRDAAAQALLENIRERHQSEESIRALRHDLKNHAITLQLLLEGQEIEEARGRLYLTAMASTSHSTPLGRSFTATQLRAGLETKYRAYTLLKAAKSPMSARKQVVLTTLEGSVPAASKMAHTFLQLCSAWAAMPSGTAPLTGSTGICPEVNTKPLTSQPWE